MNKLIKILSIICIIFSISFGIYFIKTKFFVSQEVLNKSNKNYIMDTKNNIDKGYNTQLNTYITNLQNDITSITSKYGENVGVSFYDINSGKWICINGDKKFTSYNAINIPLNILLYDKAMKDEIDLTDTMTYNYTDYEEGPGILQGENLSKPIDISTLSNYSIIYSDKIASNMLFRLLSTKYNVYEEFDKSLGHYCTYDKNSITPNDSTIYLKKLYENNDNNPYYKKLLYNMENTTSINNLSDMIDKSLIAHNQDKPNPYISDSSIVNIDNSYIVSIYTNNLDNEDDIVINIEKTILESQIHKYPNKQ